MPMSVVADRSTTTMMTVADAGVHTTTDVADDGSRYDDDVCAAGRQAVCRVDDDRYARWSTDDI